MNIQDMLGKKYERLLILKDSGKRKRGGIIVTCKCDCGTIKDIEKRVIVNGDVKSCGCLKKEYKHTPEIKEQIRKALMGNKSRTGQKNSEETRKRISKANKGRKLSPEHCRKLGLTKIGNKNMVGRKLSEETKKKLHDINFKGGCYSYWHNKAKKNFGKDRCESCGITDRKCQELYKRRLSMHNTLTPKDYSVMESHAWKCVCSQCHGVIESHPNPELFNDVNFEQLEDVFLKEKGD